MNLGVKVMEWMWHGVRAGIWVWVQMRLWVITKEEVI